MPETTFNQLWEGRLVGRTVRSHDPSSLAVRGVFSLLDSSESTLKLDGNEKREVLYGIVAIGGYFKFERVLSL